jgi:DNA-binding YbaB/EbfC family protein
MGSFQEKLDAIKITGSAGGGMIQIDMNGKMEALAVRIEKEVMEDREMLQDLVCAACNNAMEKVREAVNREMGNMLPGGIMPNMPGFSK